MNVNIDCNAHTYMVEVRGAPAISEYLLLSGCSREGDVYRQTLLDGERDVFDAPDA